MSSDDEFNEIISNIGDDFQELVAKAEDEEASEDFETPLDVIAHYWKHFHPGQKFTKGILIVESEIEDEGTKGKAIHMSTSDGITSWDVMGMLKYCQEHLFYVSDDDDDDEDDD